MLFSVLFPEKLRIRENSRISGAGNSSALSSTDVPGVMPGVVDLNHIRATLVGQNAKFLLQCGPNANVLRGDVRMRI